MNNRTRGELSRILALLEDLRNEVEEIYQAEQAKVDDAPENLQGSDRYQRIEEAAQALESALDNINAALDDIQQSIE